MPRPDEFSSEPSLQGPSHAAPRFNLGRDTVPGDPSTISTGIEPPYPDRIPRPGRNGSKTRGKPQGRGGIATDTRGTATSSPGFVAILKGPVAIPAEIATGPPGKTAIPAKPAAILLGMDPCFTGREEIPMGIEPIPSVPATIPRETATNPRELRQSPEGVLRSPWGLSQSPQGAVQTKQYRSYDTITRFTIRSNRSPARYTPSSTLGSSSSTSSSSSSSTASPVPEPPSARWRSRTVVER